MPSELVIESEDDLVYLSDDMKSSPSGMPLLTHVLRINGLCPSRWNWKYFLIKRVLLLEQSVWRYMQLKREELKRAQDKAKQKDKPPLDTSYLFKTKCGQACGS